MVNEYGTMSRPMSDKSSFDGAIVATRLGLRSEVCSNERYYLADDVHKILADAKPVFNAHDARGVEYVNDHGRTWFPNRVHSSTKSGIVISVKDLSDERGDRSETALEVALLRRAVKALFGLTDSKQTIQCISEYLDHLDKEDSNASS